MGGGMSLGCTRTLDGPMNYWLAKSEPFKYSWEEFVKDKRTYWDGVRNYEARNNLKAMAKGDQVLFYHSNEGMEVVGIAKVVRSSIKIRPPKMIAGSWWT